MTPFTLRPATGADGPAIAALFRRIRQARLAYLPVLHTPEENIAFFGGQVMETCTVVIAETDRLVGFIAWRQGWVDHLYADLGHLGRGIGTALIRQAMDDQPRLALWVFQKNTAALAFYRKHGFDVVRETDGRDNEEKEPDVLMAWERGQSTGA